MTKRFKAGKRRSQKIDILESACAIALDSLRPLFMYDTKFTLICRHAEGVLDDADVVYGNDALDEARGVLDAFMAKGNKKGERNDEQA